MYSVFGYVITKNLGYCRAILNLEMVYQDDILIVYKTDPTNANKVFNYVSETYIDVMDTDYSDLPPGSVKSGNGWLDLKTLTPGEETPIYSYKELTHGTVLPSDAELIAGSTYSTSTGYFKFYKYEVVSETAVATIDTVSTTFVYKVNDVEFTKTFTSAYNGKDDQTVATTFVHDKLTLSTSGANIPVVFNSKFSSLDYYNDGIMSFTATEFTTNRVFAITDSGKTPDTWLSLNEPFDVLAYATYTKDTIPSITNLMNRTLPAITVNYVSSTLNVVLWSGTVVATVTLDIDKNRSTAICYAASLSNKVLTIDLYPNVIFDPVGKKVMFFVYNAKRIGEMVLFNYNTMTLGTYRRFVIPNVTREVASIGNQSLADTKVTT